MKPRTVGSSFPQILWDLQVCRPWKKNHTLESSHSYFLPPFLPCVKVEELGRGKSYQLKIFLVRNPETYFLLTFLIHCHKLLPNFAFNSTETNFSVPPSTVHTIAHPNSCSLLFPCFLQSFACSLPLLYRVCHARHEFATGAGSVSHSSLT